MCVRYGAWLGGELGMDGGVDIIWEMGSMMECKRDAC